MATPATFTTGGGGTMTPYAKALVAQAMAQKGRAFIGAALLVQQKGGNASVVLHLLCQGIEIFLKAVLLAKDYDTYKPRLRSLGHNLVKGAAAVRRATGLHVFSHGALVELQVLNGFYSQHLLRYASNFDIFVDPASIPHTRVVRHTLALLRHAERKATFNANAI
jgi:hypothetical protein